MPLGSCPETIALTEGRAYLSKSSHTVQVCLRQSLYCRRCWWWCYKLAPVAGAGMRRRGRYGPDGGRVDDGSRWQYLTLLGVQSRCAGGSRGVVAWTVGGSGGDGCLPGMFTRARLRERFAAVRNRGTFFLHRSLLLGQSQQTRIRTRTLVHEEIVEQHEVTIRIVPSYLAVHLASICVGRSCLVACFDIQACRTSLDLDLAHVKVFIEIND